LSNNSPNSIVGMILGDGVVWFKSFDLNHNKNQAFRFVIMFHLIFMIITFIFINYFVKYLSINLQYKKIILKTNCYLCWISIFTYIYNWIAIWFQLLQCYKLDEFGMIWRVMSHLFYAFRGLLSQRLNTLCLARMGIYIYIYIYMVNINIGWILIVFSC